MNEKNYNEAVNFAQRHIEAFEFSDKYNFGRNWSLDLERDFGIREVIDRSADESGGTPIFYNLSQESAERLLRLAEINAPAFQMAKTICSNNLIHGKPLPENMLTFAGAVLSEQVSPPASKKGQSDARRNRVLARLIFEVFVLFDLSQRKAQEAVHEGAQRAGLVVPARLREIWEASEEWKSRRIPRTRALKAKVRREASDRLEFFVVLSARHAE